MQKSPAPKTAANSNSPRRAARLAAVQALYQDSYGQQPTAEILREGMAVESSREAMKTAGLAEPDRELCDGIVRGVTENLAMVDEMIGGALAAKVSAGRMEILLRSILRAGAYELHNSPSASTSSIISDYVDVAHAFFDGREPGLVNGVLDSLAKKLREKP